MSFDTAQLIVFFPHIMRNYCAIFTIHWECVCQLKFWIYTVPSFIAARKAEGNIFCEQKKNRRISPHLDRLEKQRKDDELYKK